MAPDLNKLKKPQGLEPFNFQLRMGYRPQAGRLRYISKRRLTHTVLFRIMGARPWFERCRDS